MSILLALMLFGQQPYFEKGVICHAIVFPHTHDQCTGELLPLPDLPMRHSYRLDWLLPDSYTSDVLEELTLRITALEAKLTMLVRILAGEFATRQLQQTPPAPEVKP